MSASLTLEIKGFKKHSGQLNIAVSRVTDQLHDNLLWEDLTPIRKVTTNINSTQTELDLVELLLEDLPEGMTCIRLYLDLNNNQILERSATGLPLEPVGFSNNPSLFKGEPSPQDSCFLLQQTSNVQVIKLKHNKKRN